ncbi:PP2C family protein-serine/threonine phosphatase [Actinokineospora soli]|uniref:PP2C family protein-serine/threonine phosphatase n=1 Tax=Actinokineospora soli TaxID=1048753 RepID=A0ABW2TR68_9PSEU
MTAGRDQRDPVLAQEIAGRVQGGDPLTALVDLLEEKEHALRMHQRELEQTNRGLVALHTQLAAQQRRMALLDEVNRALGVHLVTERLVDVLTTLLRGHGLADEVAIWLPDGGTRLLARHGSADSPSDAVRHTYESRSTHHGDGRVCAALVASGLTVGVLELRRDGPFDADEADLATHIAARAASALRNAHQYERERDLAETLQRAMLPEPAAVPGASTAAVYQPPADGPNIGGDWYDAFTTPHGTLVLTVGDVTGHGLDAAVLMGRLRHVLRAYATEGHGPAAALSLVHDLLDHERGDRYATAVLAELDPVSGTLCWANAGHPPPLLRSATGGVEVLDPPRRGHMLGAGIPARIPEHRTALDPGAELLLYTDGLIERRREHIDDGIALLAAHWRALPRTDPQTAADHLVAATLGAHEQTDDVCVLICRRD